MKATRISHLFHREGKLSPSEYFFRLYFKKFTVAINATVIKHIM